MTLPCGHVIVFTLRNSSLLIASRKESILNVSRSLPVISISSLMSISSPTPTANIVVPSSRSRLATSTGSLLFGRYDCEPSVINITTLGTSIRRPYLGSSSWFLATSKALSILVNVPIKGSSSTAFLKDGRFKCSFNAILRNARELKSTTPMCGPYSLIPETVANVLRISFSF